MAMNLKTLKAVEDKYKLPVFGYVRSSQNESIIYIPMMIFYLCLGYFYDPEYFEKCCKNMQISNDKLTITQIGTGYGDDTVYCKRCIKSDVPQIMTWTLKINKDNRYGLYGLRIRIASDERLRCHNLLCISDESYIHKIQLFP